MEPKGLLTHSHVPATCPYTEPAQDKDRRARHHGMAHPQVAGRGVASIMEGSYECIE